MVRACYNKSKSCVIVFFDGSFLSRSSEFRIFLNVFFFSSHIVAEESDSFPKYSNVQIWPYREATICWGNRELKRLINVRASHHKTSLLWWFIMEQRMGHGWIPTISALPRIEGPNTRTQVVEKESPMSSVDGHPVS